MPKAGNKENKLVAPPKELLGILEKDLQVRYLEAKTNKDIKLATIKTTDKENDRQFEYYKLELERLKDSDKFGRVIGYILITIASIVILSSLYLSFNGNTIAQEVLKVTLALILGGVGGYGLSESRNKAKQK